jgi:hypothetical protein
VLGIDNLFTQRGQGHFTTPVNNGKVPAGESKKRRWGKYGPHLRNGNPSKIYLEVGSRPDNGGK